jgi:cell division protein FtsL
MTARVAGKTMVTAAIGAGDPAQGRALLWLNVAALLLVLLSCFAVIHSTHATRELYTQFITRREHLGITLPGRKGGPH